MISVLSILLLASCRSGGPDATTNVELSIRVGEYAGIEDSNRRIQFLKVLSDSRCPLKVQCVTQGVVNLALRLESPESAAPFEMVGYVSPDGDGDVSVVIDGFEITLLELSPYPIEPVSTSEIRVARLRVVRR